MNAIKEKPRCPRCGGNLFLRREAGEPEWACLQCSRTFQLAALPGRPAPPAAPARRVA